MRTSVELEGPVVERPIEAVFAFVSNLENSPRWGLVATSVRDPDSPDGVGAVFLSKSRILGQKVDHRSEVTGLHPPTEFSYDNRLENGVIERTRITFAAVEEGTRIDLEAEVEIEQVPQILAPLASLFLKQRMAALAGKLEQAFVPPDQSVMGAATMIAIGAVLLATVGLRYLIEVLHVSEWRTVLALLAASLISAGAALILWRIARRGSSEQAPAERSPGGG